MTKEATKVTGTQVKELLAKAVGGIYTNRGFNEILTDFFENIGITEKGLEIDVNGSVTLIIPINEEEQYINYAIGGEDLETDEEWEGSTYFDFKFCIGGYTICFNTEDKETELTWEQFKELTDIGNYGIFEARNMDTCSIYLDINDCTIAVNDREIEINSSNVNTIIDMGIVAAIYNDSLDVEEISYRIEFCNGMSDLVIEIGYRHRLFR